MKKLLLSTLLLAGLAGCSKKDDAAPDTATIILGDWVADDIYFMQSATSTSPATPSIPYGKAKWSVTSSAGSTALRVSPAYLIEQTTPTAVASTYITLTGNTFTFPKQTGTDSLVSISNTAFTWSHRVPGYRGGGAMRYVMHFHR